LAGHGIDVRSSASVTNDACTLLFDQSRKGRKISSFY